MSSVCLSWLQRDPDVIGRRWEICIRVQHLTQQPVNKFVFNRVFRDEARTWVRRLQGLCQMKSATTWLPPAGTCQSSWTECEAWGSQGAFARAGWSLLLKFSALIQITLTFPVNASSDAKEWVWVPGLGLPYVNSLHTHSLLTELG